jgi:hypothetical protein
VADLLRDDDTPPPSGVRRHVPDATATAPLAVLPLPSLPPRSDADVLREVGEQVFFEVYGVVRVLSPLQGAWFRIDLGQVGRAVLTAATWQGAKSRRPAKKLLRERWPELVPGHGAMSRLASLMVDILC